MILRTGNIVWGAATLAVMLGCSTLSLRVASERKAVETLRAQVARDTTRIATLQAEIATRSGLPELQRWNDQVLRLSAPSARQFVGTPVQLAAFAAPPAPPAVAPQLAIARLPDAAPPPVRTVAYAAPRGPAYEAVRAEPVAAPPALAVHAAPALADALRGGSDAPARLTQVALR